MENTRLGSRTSALGPLLVSRAMRATAYRCHYARVGCWLIVPSGALLLWGAERLSLGSQGGRGALDQQA